MRGADGKMGVDNADTVALPRVQRLVMAKEARGAYVIVTWGAGARWTLLMLLYLLLAWPVPIL
jgi:hypothetical protein